MNKKFLTSLVLGSSLCAAALVSNKCFAETRVAQQKKCEQNAKRLNEIRKYKQKQIELIIKDVYKDVYIKTKAELEELEEKSGRYFLPFEIDRKAEDQALKEVVAMRYNIRSLQAKKQRFEKDLAISSGAVSYAQAKVDVAQEKLEAVEKKLQNKNHPVEKKLQNKNHPTEVEDYELKLAGSRRDNACSELDAKMEIFRQKLDEYRGGFFQNCRVVEGDNLTRETSIFFDFDFYNLYFNIYGKILEKYYRVVPPLEKHILDEGDSESSEDGGQSVATLGQTVVFPTPPASNS